MKGRSSSCVVRENGSAMNYNDTETNTRNRLFHVFNRRALQHRQYHRRGFRRGEFRVCGGCGWRRRRCIIEYETTTSALSQYNEVRVIKTIECNVLVDEDRKAVVQLPAEIAPGQHRLVVVVDEQTPKPVIETAARPARRLRAWTVML